jgi:surface protein
MFVNAHSFNQPLNKWDVSNVTKMYCMFKNATSFNQALDKWNVSIDTFHLLSGWLKDSAS